LAVQRDIDYPENMWKAYIDFEIILENYDGARLLFRQLLDQTNHVKVWIGFAKFELDNAQHYENGRTVYSEAYANFKTEQPELKEERLMILEAWIAMEKEHGLQENYQEVKKKMPKRVKKRRKIKIIYNDQQEGDQNKEDEGGWEEFYDYIFPDDETQKRNLKIIEMAHKWKQQKSDI
jgi:crooked neck